MSSCCWYILPHNKASSTARVHIKATPDALGIVSYSQSARPGTGTPPSGCVLFLYSSQRCLSGPGVLAYMLAFHDLVCGTIFLGAKCPAAGVMHASLLPTIPALPVEHYSGSATCALCLTLGFQSSLSAPLAAPRSHQGHNTVMAARDVRYITCDLLGCHLLSNVCRTCRA